jgi:predicted nucleic acid-binding protein
VIFLDSNAPMYAVGGPHPHKDHVRLRIREAIADGRKFVTNAEVLQEILHRYTAIRRTDMIDPAFDVVTGLVDEVLPVTGEDALMAKGTVLSGGRLSARDAIHLAVMRRHRIDTILSFDRGFDRVPGIKRLGE